MKKTTILVVSILIIIIAAGAFFFSTQSNSVNSMEQQKMEQQKMAQQKQANMAGDVQKNESKDQMVNDSMSDDKMQSAKYTEFDQNSFDKNSDKKRVLFFFASWCPTCIPADADFTQNMSKIPEDVMVYRVNYNDPQTDDAEKALSKKYGVTYQHTFVQVDSNGSQVTKWNGGRINELLANIK